MVFLILAIFGILCNLGIGLFVLFQDYRSRLNRAVSWMALSLCFWQVANYFADITSRYTLYWNRATFIGPMFVFFFANLFVYNLEKNKPFSNRQKFLFIGNVFLSIFVLTDQVISEVTPRISGGEIVGYNLIRNYGYWIVVSWLTYQVVDFIVTIHGVRNKAGGKLRSQMNVIVKGLTYALILGIATNLILPILTHSSASAKFAPLTGIVIMSTFAYAIAKHGLLDIKFIVVRAATYSLSILTLSIVYIAPLMFVMITIMGFKFEVSKFLIALVVASLTAFYYQGIRKKFDDITASIFYRNAYDPELFISQLNKAVVSNLDIQDMLSVASKIITENMKAEFCLFYISDNTVNPRIFGASKTTHIENYNHLSEQIASSQEHMLITRYMREDNVFRKNLEKNNIAVIGELANKSDLQQGISNMIILGSKKGGDVYNKRDLSILETVTNGLIVAIQNALRFEEIQKFNITLQQRVDDATAQLRRTNAKLKALDESKDDFISMASHQLRTPLTAVKGYLSMVIEEDAGPVTKLQKKMLSQAFISSQRMVFLIADLLNVSRLKTGKFVIERMPLDLAHLISQEIGQLRETAASRSIELSYVKPKNFPVLMLDETKSRQVVMNFVDNAIHYTPAGGHIRVELTDRLHAVELRVIDDGIGVPKAEQHHLFTKFYRAINARRERPDGTGLGLFMAKKVIVAQGGAVIFESKENKGSTFGFVIPKAKLLAPAPQQPVS